MVKLFQKTVKTFSSQQHGVLSAASIIMMTVFASRVLGLVRDRMLAARFTPDELGVYYAAFRLPNLIFELLVMGALSTAFIPVFTKYLETDKKEEAFTMASSIINLGVIAFALFCIPMLVFNYQICQFLAPGFNHQQLTLMADFTKVMILAQVGPLLVGNFLTGILQSFRNFLVPSLAPVLYNVGIIIGILFLTGSTGLYAPVYGVVIGSVLFTVIQIPIALAYGYKHRLQLNMHHPGVRDVGRLMIPRTLGLAVSQIDTSVDLILSTLLGASAVTIFNFAQHLQQIPIGLFGASLAQAALPSMSAAWARKNMEQFQSVFLSSFTQILFLVIPISAILVVLRIPVVRLVFGASQFDWNATVSTGRTLAYFSLSLFAQAQVNLLARAFYAMHDSKTPVIIGAICVLVNTVLSIVFVKYMHLPVWYLGLSTSVASIANAVFLLLFLHKKVGGFSATLLFSPMIKILLAGLVTGFSMYIPIKLLDQLVFDTTRTFSLFLLTGISTVIGISVYLFLSWFLEIPEFSLLFKLLRRSDRLKGVLVETDQEVVNVPKS